MNEGNRAHHHDHNASGTNTKKHSGKDGWARPVRDPPDNQRSPEREEKQRSSGDRPTESAEQYRAPMIKKRSTRDGQQKQSHVKAQRRLRKGTTRRAHNCLADGARLYRNNRLFPNTQALFSVATLYVLI